MWAETPKGTIGEKVVGRKVYRGSSGVLAESFRMSGRATSGPEEEEGKAEEGEEGEEGEEER